nr:MAG TPA: hypothetical protein [Caudoviricetes sp.]
MLDTLTILEYARKGALADYEKACMMHRLLNVKETQALINDAWGTAKEITRLMNLKVEQAKQAESDAEEAAQKRSVSAGRFVAPEPPVEPQQSEDLWIVSISYANGAHTVTEYEDEGVAKQCYEVIQFMDKKRKNSALVRMALIHNDRTVKSYDRD